MKKILIISLYMSGCMAAFAGPLDDAARLVKEGDYWSARNMLDKEKASNPKVTASPQFNYLMGVCDYETGNYKESRKYLETAKSKGNGFANLYLGRLAFLDYDFDTASDFYADFRKYRDKLGQVAGEDVEESERELMAARNALERVEDIEVIDSLAVPAEGFFSYYKLPSSAGRFLKPEEMPLEKHRDGAVMAFMNEGKDYMMWGEPDSIGNVHIVESIRLTDGKWQEPVAAPDFLGKGGYADYPFMMPDGVTLYYSSDGNDSMGGYDIFVVSRDAQTGEYLQPQNVGMPFNSPHDDFLLAIDEENGVGWWATDRNLLGDKLTIYVYKVNELRKNYNPDDEDVIAKARLADYRSTQDPDNSEEYASMLEAIENIGSDDDNADAEFHFPKKGGGYFTKYEQLQKPAAREALKKYFEWEDFLNSEEKKLADLRRRYPVNRADNVKKQIVEFEKDIDKQRQRLVSLRSEVYRLEYGK